MRKIHKIVTELKSSGEKGISFFLTGGYPDMGSFAEILQLIGNEELADFVEIGIPFSDPVADGPTIQASSAKAIKQGATFKSILETLEKMKDSLSCGLVLMCYANSLYSGTGMTDNLLRAYKAGITGIIVPDMPPEETRVEVRGSDLDRFIFLAAPSTGKKRLELISSMPAPFLYYVNTYGVTGARSSFHPGLLERVKEVSASVGKTVYCGFGISTPEQASQLARVSDGIIIGSALVSIIRDNPKKYLEEIRKFAIKIKKSLGRN